jgi:hypothetical protein
VTEIVGLNGVIVVEKLKMEWQDPISFQGLHFVRFQQLYC